MLQHRSQNDNLVFISPERSRQTLDVLAGLAHQPKSDALSRLGADAGKTSELVDHRLQRREGSSRNLLGARKHLRNKVIGRRVDQKQRVSSPPSNSSSIGTGLRCLSTFGRARSTQRRVDGPKHGERRS